MAYRSFQLLKFMKNNNLSINNLKFVSSTKHVYLNTVKRKEYKTEENLIYYEDPDNFGTLSRLINIPKIEPEYEDDIKEEKYLEDNPLPSQKLTTRQYADLIKQYLKHKRLKEALDVLEVRMLSQDRASPENYIYNILIGACADVGYTKKAFKLFNDMKRRALKVTGDTYTCLFNACANSPWPADGLKRAQHLRELMVEKGVEPNLTNYNVMIKAFGRCGDLSTAFQIVDEMKDKGINIRVHTINFLLQACITDKSTGLRHALVIWRKMLNLKEKPNIYSFNLMLKCVKDCNLGSKQDIEDLISIIKQNLLVSHKSNVLLLENKNKLLPESDKNYEIQHNNKDMVVSNSRETMFEIVNFPKTLLVEKRIVPNLLSKIPQMKEVMDLQAVTSVQDKFAIIGGEDDFLKEMDTYSVKPNIKTFTQILPLLDNTTEAENTLLNHMKEYGVRADIDFYNMLIKKRCLRSCYSDAIAVKDMIAIENKHRKKKHFMKKKLILKCNIMTYGILAMTCKTKEDAEKLLQEMKDEGLKINAEILGTLLRQGTAQSNFGHILFIMNEVKNQKLQINHIFLSHLEAFNEKCKSLMEMDENNKRKCSETFVNAYNIYMMAYRKWLKDVEIEKVLKDDHPWKQFRENIPEPLQRQHLINEPKKFYKRNRKFVKPYTVKT